MDEPGLHHRWDRLCARVGAFASASEADLTFETILTLYAHPPRSYHTLEHVAACLHAFDQVALLAEDKDATEFALWLHDAVFIAERPDNERRSADAAGMIAGLLGCSPPFTQRVRELILATKHDDHEPIGDAALVADLDLADLGADPDIYAAYREAIDREYGFASREHFLRGRTAFLHRMLDRDDIYATAWFRSQREATARRNLNDELRAREAELDRLAG